MKSRPKGVGPVEGTLLSSTVLNRGCTEGDNVMRSWELLWFDLGLCTSNYRTRASLDDVAGTREGVWAEKWCSFPLWFIQQIIVHLSVPGARHGVPSGEKNTHWLLLTENTAKSGRRRQRDEHTSRCLLNKDNEAGEKKKNRILLQENEA